MIVTTICALRGARATIGFACLVWLLPVAVQAETGLPHRLLFVMNTDGTDPEPLAADPNRCYGSARWSHDGNRIVYDSWIKNAGYATSHIFVANSDGTRPKDLGPGAMPSWSTDDLQIACHTYQSAGAVGQGIVVMNVDGKGRELVVPGKGSPRWRPGQRGLAYYDWGRNIRLLERHSGKTRKLLVDGFSPMLGFCWSPDGRHLGFVSGDRLCAAPCDGPRPSQDVMVLARGIIGSHVAWSPDGTTLLCSMRSPDQGPYRIFQVPADASGKPKMISEARSTSHNIEPTFSPDGKKILFVRERRDS